VALFTRTEKLNAESYWAPRIADILSEESAEKARRLRAQHEDPAIKLTDEGIWSGHLKAVRIELAAVALARNNDAAMGSDATLALLEVMKARCPELVVLCDLYDRAFSDAAVDGVMVMSHISNASVTHGAMQPETLTWLREGFQAELRDRASEWKRLRLIKGEPD
jgi:hypothetical protein